MQMVSKILALILAMLMVVSVFAACEQKKSEATEAGVAEATEASDTLVGAFTPAESPVVTDDIKALVEKATADLDGAAYTPVAYVASQVVAGTNHLILCELTTVVPDAVGHYALVTIYEDLNGEAEITDVLVSDAEAPVVDEDGTALAGGYYERETPVVTDEAKEALEKACEGLSGAAYEPVALVEKVPVSGIVYKLLCMIAPVTENPEAHYSIVSVYVDLDGNAEITETADFSAAK